MSNSTIENSDESNTSVVIVAYYSLSLVIVGTLCNLLTLLVLCLPKFRDTNERPTLLYMRTIAIFDILMLYGWNLEHYTITMFGFGIGTYTIASCKYSSFINYFTTQTSAWLRVFVCLDRYLALSRLHRTWFTHPKSVLIIIGCVLGFFTLFNLHLLIFACFYDTDGLLNPNSRLYTIYPLWDLVQLGMYNCLPFAFMVLFNSGVIYHLIRLHLRSTIQNSNIRHRAISITLIITTLLFLIMTIPTSVAYSFFSATAGDIILFVLDSLLYTYHILSFPLYMVTLGEFRQEFIKLITCGNGPRRIIPLLSSTTQPARRA